MPSGKEIQVAWTRYGEHLLFLSVVIISPSTAEWDPLFVFLAIEFQVTQDIGGRRD